MTAGEDNPVPSEQSKRARLRMTLGGMILLVALAALGINAVRPVHTKVLDVKVGAGPAVKEGNTLVLHYVGKLADGKVFDSSKPRGQPFEVVVGRGSVIKGWDVGLIGMREGGVRQLEIPPGEAYGTKGQPPVIPANSTLYFEVELIGIR